MNTDKNHLMDTSELTEDKLKSLLDNGYEEIPKELSRAAKRKLNGKKEAYVSFTSGGKLSRFAARKRKAKRKLQKTSRKK